MTERIISAFSSRFEKASSVNSSSKAITEPSVRVDTLLWLPINYAKNQHSVNEVSSQKFKKFDAITSFNYDYLQALGTVTQSINQATVPRDNSCLFVYDTFDKFQANNKGYYTKAPSKDTINNHLHRSVNLLAQRPKRPGDYRYLVTNDFDLNNELIGFTANFIEPQDPDLIKVRLSPVDSVSKHPWQKSKPVDVFKRLGYGYSINAFLVGGRVFTSYPVDEDALTPDVEPPVNRKVIRIVNTVSAKVLPSNTPLLFSNIRVSRQIDAFAWDCTITLLDQASLDLVKPNIIDGTKEIEVEINGNVWRFFISKTGTQTSFGEKTFTAKGFSNTAKLQAPYAPRNNYANTSSATASQHVNDVLSGSGFTAIWNVSTDWVIPANTFVYQNKSPIDAIAQIASSVGAVIEPDLVNKTLTIKPWASTSAWAWSGLSGLPVIDAAECYDISEDYTPEDSANAVYVSGEENGVIVKCVINATPGDKLLQTITDPLLTDTAAALERGRIALSQSGNKENVPITLFVDEAIPLNMPGNMVNVIMDGANWNGLVSSLTVSADNSGAQVYQNLNVVRHHE